jgi:hypothetical protein
VKNPVILRLIKEIGQWVEYNYHVSVKYQTLHKQLHYRMKAKLKEPQPVSNEKAQEVAIELKKNQKSCSITIERNKITAFVVKLLSKSKKINLESRINQGELKIINGTYTSFKPK